MSMRLRVILLVATVLCPFTAPVSSAGDAVEGLRAIYERQLGLLDVDAGSNRQALVVWYGHQLQQLREDLKKKGDLEGLVAVVAEAERFQAKRSLPDTLSSADTKLGGLHGALSARLEQANAEGAKRHIALLRHYLNALTQKKREFVAAEKLPEALAVNEEIKKMESLRATLEGKTGNPPESQSPPQADPRAAPKPPEGTP